MKKLFSIICTVILLLSGCTTTTNGGGLESVSNTALKWLTNFPVTGIQESYFNSVLHDKGYPYTVSFIYVSPETYQETKTKYATEKTPLDIMFFGPATVNESLSANVDFYSGLVLPLNSYLESELGLSLREQYTTTVWASSKIDGQFFGVPSPTSPPAQLIYLWDRALADKYDIHPELWNSNVNNYKDDILKVCIGEKGNSDFIAFSNTNVMEDIFPSYTRILESELYYISERASENEVLYRDELPEYQSMKQLIDAVTKVDALNKAPENPEYFLLPLPYSNSDEELQLRFGSDYLEKYGILRIGDLIFKRENLGFYNSIASWSEHPDEAFELLAAISTDADLSNALAWGVPEKEYKLVDGVVTEHVRTPFYNTIGGNYWISHPGILDPKNKKLLFQPLYENAQPSKLLGFWYDLSGADSSNTDAMKAALQEEINTWLDGK